MVICDICGAKFSENKNLLRHKREKHEKINFPCSQCPLTFTRRDNLKKHQKTHGKRDPETPQKRRGSTEQESAKKRKIAADEPSTSSSNHEAPPSEQGTDSAEKDDDFQMDELSPEMNAAIHALMDQMESVPVVPQAHDQLEEMSVLGHAIYCARLTPATIVTDVDAFLNRHRQALVNYLRLKLTEKKGIKWYLVIRARYTRELNTGEEVEYLAYHHSGVRQTLTEDTIASQIESCAEVLKRHIEEFQKRGSGWVLDRILFLQINIIAYLPLVGGTYLELPKELANKKAILNIRNFDQKCLIWSILGHLHPDKSKNPSRVQKYMAFEDDLDVSDISFPFVLNADRLEKFEKKNNLSVNIFCYEKGVFPRYISSNKVCKERQVDLLMLKRGESQHYCLIRNLSRLLSNFSKRDHTMHYCRYCLHRFSGPNSKKNRDEHVKECCIHGPQKIVMPEEDPVLKFKKNGWKEKIKYVIYADFETVLPKVNTCLPDSTLSSTTTLSLHVSCGFSYVIVGPDGTSSKPVTYRGKDATEKFLDRLITEEKILQEKIKENKPMELTGDEKIAFSQAGSCYVCDGVFTKKDYKVRDHDHVTGAFRGAAHNSCNLQLKPARHIPVFMHNLSRYDAHIIMDKIGLIKEQEINCIPTNSETYISFSLGRLRFLDTIRFMPASLEVLASNLAKCGPEKFPRMNSVYQPEEVKLLLRKQVYPYDHMDDESRFDETLLPPKEAFYNTLTDEHISDEDYAHAQNVWRKFSINNLGEYHDLYVQSDVLLLADIFESFRTMCLDYYTLDCAHAFTGPGFAWESALCMTGVKLDLLTCPDKHLFFEKGIRGGVSMISHRFAQANNKYLPETYDPSKPNSYITYLDCNNLYGTVMCDYLPMGDFKWIQPCSDFTNEIILSHPDDDSVGYVLEVDLECPESIHDQLNCYPMAPEKRIITTSELSPYSKDQLKELGVGEKDSFPKLVPSLYKKEKYVVHYRNLKYYVSKGLVINKVHRIMSFNQGAWLKPFIEFNTEKRKLAVNDFERDFFKLMNNSVFGKTMENLRNRIDFHLVQTPERAIKKANSPTFERFTVFKNDLVGIHRVKKTLTLNRPIYTGFAILDLSKLLMYRFHYDVIRLQYGDAAKLLFTDTDSLTYHIETEDIYEDFAVNSQMYDFSGYPKDHPLYSEENKKVLGKFKDELDGIPVQEFCGLRPKMYSMLSAKGEKKTAKGICRRVIKKKVRHAQYRECLLKRQLTVESMKRIVSKKHELFTISQTKLCLNPCDDKRYIIDGVSTLAHGHYKIGNEV